MAKKKTKDTEFDFEADMAIDKNDLPGEWLGHAQKMMRYGELYAHADRIAKRAEENVKIIRSEIIRELEEGGEKLTGAIIEARYRVDERHQAAKRKLIKAQHNAKVLEHAVSAMRARRAALENLVQLLFGGFFSAPKDVDLRHSGSFNKSAEEEIEKRVKSEFKKRQKKKEER